jgi:hypothetical protein
MGSFVLPPHMLVLHLVRDQWTWSLKTHFILSPRTLSRGHPFGRHTLKNSLFFTSFSFLPRRLLCTWPLMIIVHSRACIGRGKRTPLNKQAVINQGQSRPQRSRRLLSLLCLAPCCVHDGRVCAVLFFLRSRHSLVSPRPSTPTSDDASNDY